jgi:hypothetical protein
LSGGKAVVAGDALLRTRGTKIFDCVGNLPGLNYIFSVLLFVDGLRRRWLSGLVWENFGGN